MRRTVILVAAAALLVVGTGTAVAHGNELVVTDQVSADGTLLVEHVTTIEDAYLVARVPTGDGPGEPVGHRAVDVSGTAFGEHDLVSLALNDTYWDAHGSGDRLWVVLHNRDGDDGFDVADDPLVVQDGEPVGERIAVGRGDGNVSVAAFDQEANASVTVRRVELASTGHLVFHANATDGPVVGHVSLAAGVHTNVTVPVNGYFYNDRNGSFTLVAVAYGDDGDGSFDAAADDPVRAGEAPVASALAVTKVAPSVAVTPTATETPTPTPTATPTGTPTAAATPDATDTPTATAGPTPTPAPTAEAAMERTDSGPSETTGETGPAVGLAGMLAAVLLAALAGARRR